MPGTREADWKSHWSSGALRATKEQRDYDVVLIIVTLLAREPTWLATK